MKKIIEYTILFIVFCTINFIVTISYSNNTNNESKIVEKENEFVPFVEYKILKNKKKICIVHMDEDEIYFSYKWKIAHGWFDSDGNSVAVGKIFGCDGEDITRFVEECERSKAIKEVLN